MKTSERARFGFMQARIQARHGQRLGSDQWRQLESCREPGRYLQLLQQGSLRWASREMSAGDTVQAWERILRRQWHAYLDEVSGWAPAAWGPFLAWLHRLPELPVLHHLARGGAILPWMAQDPRLRGILDHAPGNAVTRSGVGATPDESLQDAEPILSLDAWHGAWIMRLPGGAAPVARELDALRSRMRDVDRSAGPGLAEWREAVEGEFTWLLRRRARSILALIGHLGLVGLDLQRLRGTLLVLAITRTGAGTGP